MKPITPKMLAGLSTKEKPELMAPLAAAMNEFFPVFEIDTELRQENFLPQALHESDGFHTLEEYASGSAYEGRRDLGNIKKGDGRRFKGGGIFQDTGRANYIRLTKQFREMGENVDLVAHPELLRTPRYAVLAACLYWREKKLNALADRDDIRAITKKINGGYNGLEDRIRYRDRCRLAIDRSDATVATLRAQGSTTVKGSDTVQKVSLFTGAAAVGGPVLNQFEGVSDTVNRVRWAWEPFNDLLSPFLEWIWKHPTFILVPFAVAALYYAHRVKVKRLEEYQAGKVQ